MSQTKMRNGRIIISRIIHFGKNNINMSNDFDNLKNKKKDKINFEEKKIGSHFVLNFLKLSVKEKFCPFHHFVRKRFDQI